ncbi:RagB/SusD family nutrient uptake outer membrane protein [Psychroserpens jangbogonensis]|uniref:RagB/SusD family nutrient uptake outer membrane protein n=1 Tax=Psychroserpens jangbogonensis TaxID=1484460 RepID=UPI0013793884|nr:RagB/SusD family nutrient uptake outer membrane protein [Psychroserpens jangbogonensis]
MKKYTIILSTIFAMAFMSSCDQENLNLNPFNAVGVDVALNNANDFEIAVNGLYSMMIESTYYGADFMSFPDVLADNLIINLDARQTQRTTFEWRYNPNNTRGNFMVNAYDVVQHANFILENTSKLSAGAQRDNIEAQCLAARALAHFDINNVFGMIPTQEAGANSSLGISLNFSSDIRQTLGRNTVEQVYTSVIADLVAASAKISGSNGIERFNADAINGLLSRVYLYNGQYQQASDAADAVTGSVAQFGNFTGLWDDSSDDGVLFKLINRDADTDVSTAVPYSQTLTSGIFSEYVIDFGFFNLYSPQDVRLGAFIETSPFDGVLYNHVSIHNSSSINAGSGVVDIKVIRAAEVQLNKAEALANLNQDGPALAALDLVRSQRYVIPAAGETGQALKDAIQLERRLELAFQGHRFFDIKRQGQSIQRTNAGQLADGTGTPPLFLNLPAGDCLFELAIPVTEINVNPASSQNPCY